MSRQVASAVIGEASLTGVGVRWGFASEGRRRGSATGNAERRACALCGSLRAALLDTAEDAASDAGFATAGDMASQSASTARARRRSLSALEPIDS